MSCQKCTHKVLHAWLQNLTCSHLNQPLVLPCLLPQLRHRRWYRSTRPSTASSEQSVKRREERSEGEYVPFERDSQTDPDLISRRSGQQAKPNGLVERVMRAKYERMQSFKVQNLNHQSPSAKEVTRQKPDEVTAPIDGEKRLDGNRSIGKIPLHKQGASTVALVEPDLPRRKPNSEREPWQVQKDGLKKKLGGAAWAPKKKLSPDAMDGIRKLHSQQPNLYTTPYLAKQFEVSPEVIRRILKSKWRPTEEEEEDRRRRWEKRGEAIWTSMAEQGLKPPKKWRQKGVNSAEWKTKLALQRRRIPGACEAREERRPSIASRIL